jgi:hypothetical protein
MATQAKVIIIRRGRGRPRLNNVRIECNVPREVLDKLVEAESRTGIYRTRVAAHILCEWAGTKAPDSQHLSA